MDYQLHDLGANNLAYAIVRSAIRDYFSKNPKIKEDAISFINSDLFVVLTNGKIDPDDVMEKLRKSKPSDYFTKAGYFIIHD